MDFSGEEHRCNNYQIQSDEWKDLDAWIQDDGTGGFIVDEGENSRNFLSEVVLSEMEKWVWPGFQVTDVISTPTSVKEVEHTSTNYVTDDKKKSVSSSSYRTATHEMHNFNERVRRGNINNKIKALHDLIPRSHNHKTNKVCMLDEVYYYIRNLQLQLENVSAAAAAAAATAHTINPNLINSMPGIDQQQQPVIYYPPM